MCLVNLMRNWRSVCIAAGRLLPVLLLTGCLGGNYQAPISEQGETMDQSGPEIVVNSDDSPTRYATDGSRTNPQSVSRAVASGSGRPAIHRVASGDSLYAIAFQYDLDVRDLARTNNLSPPYTLFVGQELSLDMERPVTTEAAGESSSLGIGRVVGNNNVARAQAASSTARGVIRQPLTRTPIDDATSVPEEPQWQWPVRGRILTNFQADTSARKGIDIGAVAGQPVQAAASGEVVYAGNGIQGSGNLIIIRHSERLLSAYAHNREMLVSEGQQVRAGDQIGEAGANEEGVPLVHFEIRLDGNPVDPLGYLPRL